MEPEQTQATVAVTQPESEAVPETQSIEVTQTTSEIELSREPSEVREEGVYVDSSYLEPTPSAAVVAVEESKPDDLVTQVVQPDKPVEPSGIEEDKEGEEEEEVEERSPCNDRY